MFWGVVASMYVGNVILLVLNLPLIGLWVQLLRVPYGILFPLILLFCVIGVYSEAGNVWDIVVMLIFAVLGYLMKKVGYEAAPLVLAFVLGRMAEESIRQSLLMSRGSFEIEQTGREADEPSTENTNTWLAPTEPGPVTLWLVIRDSRGGASWETYYVEVEP